MSSESEQPSFTNITHYSHKFSVPIDEPFHLDQPGESIYLDEFSTGLGSGYHFQLRILNIDTDRFVIYLINCGEYQADILKFKVKSSTVNKEGQKTDFSLKSQASIPLPDFNFKDFIITPTRNTVKTVHKDFTCSIVIDATDEVQDLLNPEESGGGLFSGFLKDFGREKDDPTFADATLVCEGQEIPCHQVFLAAKSDVFRNMFSKDFIEGQTKKAKIVNVNLATLKAMLSFIYTNNFKARTVNIADLFEAADQYLITDLRDKCESLLIQDLTASNAIKYFTLAFRHGGSKLKTASVDVIYDNFSQIRVSPEWAQLKADPNAPEALQDILLNVIDY